MTQIAPIKVGQNIPFDVGIPSQAILADITFKVIELPTFTPPIFEAVVFKLQAKQYFIPTSKAKICNVLGLDPYSDIIDLEKSIEVTPTRLSPEDLKSFVIKSLSQIKQRTIK